jgi:hypothetical protein
LLVESLSVPATTRRTPRQARTRDDSERPMSLSITWPAPLLAWM